MKVELVSYTQPAETIKLRGVKEIRDLVAYCARVSNPSNQFNNETYDKLNNYLIKNKHWSPLEMVNICLEIETTRDIARQILRHRSFTFQEFSQRYSNPLEQLCFSTKDARLQDTKNRQNSIVTDDHKLQEKWLKKQNKVIELSKQVYKWAIDNNIAKEQARAVLPEGLTMSRMYVNGSLRSWIHYVELRRKEGTQLEHRLIAEKCGNVLKELINFNF